MAKALLSLRFGYAISDPERHLVGRAHPRDHRALIYLIMVATSPVQLVGLTSRALTLNGNQVHLFSARSVTVSPYLFKLSIALAIFAWLSTLYHDKTTKAFESLDHLHGNALIYHRS